MLNLQIPHYYVDLQIPLNLRVFNPGYFFDDYIIYLYIYTFYVNVLIVDTVTNTMKTL